MPQPMDDQALQQVGTAEEGAVERRRPADHDMIAAAGSGMLAVDHELVGAEPREPRLLVDRLGRRDALAPARGGMDVHLDHAGVRRDADHVEARIDRRGVALDLDRQADLLGRGLRRGDELEIVLELLDRRHEDAEPPVARFDRQRGADHRRRCRRASARSVPGSAGFVRGERGDPLRMLPQRLALRQRPARDGRIGLDDIRERRWRNMGKRAERQAIADRTVAGRQIKARRGGSSIFRCASAGPSACACQRWTGST